MYRRLTAFVEVDFSSMRGGNGMEFKPSQSDLELESNESRLKSRRERCFSNFIVILLPLGGDNKRGRRRKETGI
jgi:hypothetical protein